MTKGAVLEPFAYEPPRLKEPEVRVSVSHCGICYTDIHGIEDFYGISTFPFVPGHEIVGRVSELGASVEGLEEGDRVGIGWQGRSCTKCEDCRRGDPQLCVDVDHAAVWSPYGGFSTSVVADHRFVYPLPDIMPAEIAAVLMCAGIAVYNPLRPMATASSRKVGVVGVGGLGHLAIQFAHALGCEVTAISSSPSKQDEAVEFGADRFILAGDKDAMKTIATGLDLILYASHAEADWTRLVLSLRRNGRIAVVGFPPGLLAFDPMELVVRQLSVTGSLLGSPTLMREMLSFAHAHGIRPRVELMPVAAANDALQRLRENRARYRIVLVNEAQASER